MKTLLMAGALWVMGCLLGATGVAAEPGSTKPIAPGDARAVRSVIQAQLDAFALGDAARAFSFASPGIRKQFGDATNFMHMVRQGYPMVIRPASVSYFQPESKEGAVFQMLRLRDQNGKFWRALYEVRQQADKTWRINGCVVQADEEGSTT